MDYVKKNLSLLFIFLISLLPLINLLHQGLFLTHDGLDHVARIASFYSSLKEGNIIPRWSGNLNWGYGHPIFMFLYPLPSFSASFFHLLGFSFVNSLKIVFAISYSLSGIFMFLWLRKFLNSKSAVVGSILYLFSPYRFIDIYVRGAIGEHVAFVFLPLVLLALYNIFTNKTKLIRHLYLDFLFVAISFSFLILSHNAISLLFIPFIIFYCLYLYFQNKDKQKLIFSSMSLFFGFLFSFFFWFPAFFEGKYTLRDIVTRGEYAFRFVEIKQLFYGSWSYGGTGQFTVQLGIVSIILTVAATIFLFKYWKSKDREKYLLLGSLIFLLASIFLMLPQSNFIWSKITTLEKLQFPWRFLSITTFCMSLSGAILIEKINLKNKIKDILILLILLGIVLPTINYWHAKEYKFFTDSFFERLYPSTTDTGESSPIWSTRAMEHYPKNKLELIDGKAEFNILPWTSTYHEYAIDVKQDARFRENTLYFPGWKIYDNNKLISNIEFQDPKNRGVMTFRLEKGLHDIILKFEDTKIRKISNFISLISIIFVILIPVIFLIFPNHKIRKYKW